MITVLKNSPFCNKKITAAGILLNAGLLCILLFCLKDNVSAADRILAQDHIPVVVIDPGHGGENKGTMEGDVIEKEMNIITGTAMYNELLEYDGVKVYMTRTGDEELSLLERAEYAKSVNADILISLHYNGSEEHVFFGSEAWVCGFTPYNAGCYQLADVMLNELTDEFGIFNRGIKTRYSGGDETDYYGVIREARELEIPALIFEHAHVDNLNDKAFTSSPEAFEKLGKADATAVAKYFGLKRKDGSADYSGFTVKEAYEDEINKYTVRDVTDPGLCFIKINDADVVNSKLFLNVRGMDSDSYLNYYAVSLDGGKTVSDLKIWPGADANEFTCNDKFDIEIDLSGTYNPVIVVRAYNTYDRYTDSNKIEIFHDYTKEYEKVELSSYEFDASRFIDKYYVPEEVSKKDSTIFFIIFIFAFSTMMVGLTLLIYVKRKQN